MRGKPQAEKGRGIRNSFSIWGLRERRLLGSMAHHLENKQIRREGPTPSRNFSGGGERGRQKGHFFQFKRVNLQEESGDPHVMRKGGGVRKRREKKRKIRA